MMKSTKAFTLIELVVMVALGSTLMWVLLKHYDGVVAEWRDRQAVREARHLLQLTRLTALPVAWQWHGVLLEQAQDDAGLDDVGLAVLPRGALDPDRDSEPVAPRATSFAQLSAVTSTSLSLLRDRLAALPDRPANPALTRSVVDHGDPLLLYALDGTVRAPAMTLRRPIRYRPHATTGSGTVGEPMQVHYRLSAAELALYTLPARIERQAFALGEEPDGWADRDE